MKAYSELDFKRWQSWEGFRGKKDFEGFLLDEVGGESAKSSIISRVTHQRAFVPSCSDGPIYLVTA